MYMYVFIGSKDVKVSIGEHSSLRATGFKRSLVFGVRLQRKRALGSGLRRFMGRARNR